MQNHLDDENRQLERIVTDRARTAIRCGRSVLAPAVAPRAGSAAWAIIDALPAHPIITAPMAAVAIGRVKTAIYDAIEQLVAAQILVPLSESKRKRSWEASGPPDLIERLEAGERPGR